MAFFVLLIICCFYIYILWKIDTYELATSLVSTSKPSNSKFMLRLVTWVWMFPLTKIYIELSIASFSWSNKFIKSNWSKKEKNWLTNKFQKNILLVINWWRTLNFKVRFYMKLSLGQGGIIKEVLVLMLWS